MSLSNKELKFLKQMIFFEAWRRMVRNGPLASQHKAPSVINNKLSIKELITKSSDIFVVFDHRPNKL